MKLHRTYFNSFSTKPDPFRTYLESWKLHLPTMELVEWNESNVDLEINEWVKRAVNDRAPVFISEYVRWHALHEHGGLYLDADIEVVNGQKIVELVDECLASDEYDAFVGVESLGNGAPTAQTVFSKGKSDLVDFMLDLYASRLEPFWIWRETRGLIGPQLMSLYFYDHGATMNMGFFPNLKEPVIVGRVKIYPQDYFSPKFGLDGGEMFVTSNTCLYHHFANSNVEQIDGKLRKLQEKPQSFAKYKAALTTKPQRNKPLALRDKLRGKSSAMKLVIALTFITLHPIYSLRVLQDLVRKFN
jgi:hypothetical protein